MTKALAFGQNYSPAGGHRPVRRPGTGGGVLDAIDNNVVVRWLFYLVVGVGLILGFVVFLVVAAGIG